MNDEEILELFSLRSENAISETRRKYGNFCSKIIYNILENREETEECENDVIDVKLRAFSQMKMYICCLIAGCCYIIAALLDIGKMFYDFPFVQNLKWIIVIIARFVIFALALSGATCNWDFWNRLYKCLKKPYEDNNEEEEWDEIKKMEPYKRMPKLMIFFIIVLICGVIGFALDVVVSLFYRKNGNGSGSSGQGANTGKTCENAPSEMKEMKNNEQQVQGDVVPVQGKGAEV